MMLSLSWEQVLVGPGFQQQEDWAPRAGAGQPTSLYPGGSRRPCCFSDPQVNLNKPGVEEVMPKSSRNLAVTSPSSGPRTQTPGYNKGGMPQPGCRLCL